MSRPSPIPMRWRVAAALAALVLAAFWPVLSAGFTNYDDGKYVTENPYVRAGVTPGGIAWAWTTFHASNWHPLTWWSHMLDWELHGPAAGGHHLTSLLLHLANTILLLFALERMTGRLVPSAAAALLFGLHPLHVESVAWIAERKDVLSTLFAWTTILAWIRWVESPRPWRYAVVVASFAAGLASKPMLVTLPFVLMLLDYWPLGRIGRGSVRAGKLVVEKLPLLALSGASAAITVVAQSRGDAMDTLARLPWSARVENALVTWVVYLRKTVWPDDLAVFYPHPGTGHSAGAVVLAAAILAAVTFVAWREATRRPWLIVGWLWYLGTLVPVIGLVQVGRQALADRYTYLPLVGIFVALAWGVAELAKGRTAKRDDAGDRRLGWIVAALAPVLVLLTWHQSTRWRDSIALFEHALEIAPSAVAHNNLGLALRDAGRTDEAVEHFRSAVGLDPLHASSHGNLGLALAESGQPEAALAHHHRALEIEPERPELHGNLALALMAAGRVETALEHYREAIRLDPGYAAAHGNLGIALAAIGRTDEAVAAYRTAVELDPFFAEAHNNLGLALAGSGRYEDAVRAFDAAIAARPDYARAHYNRAAALYMTGSYAESWRSVRRAATHGLDAPEGFIDRLRRKMPEPPP